MLTFLLPLTLPERISGGGQALRAARTHFDPGETSKDKNERRQFARCLALLTGGEDDGGASIANGSGGV
jgi:hypothetical protein